MPDLGHLLLSLLLLASFLVNIHLVRKGWTVNSEHPSPKPTDPPTIREEGEPLEQLPMRPKSVALDDNMPESIDESDLVRFVRLHTDICEEIAFLQDKSHEADSLKEILRLLTQALGDCGVEQFSPTIGESYRTAFGVAPRPTIIDTDDSDKEWTIAEVISPGFCAKLPQTRCLKQASVAVYKHHRTG